MNTRFILWLLSLYGLFGLHSCQQPEQTADVSPPEMCPMLPAAASPPAPPRLKFTHFSIENGLCGNAISDLFQDRQGFIWIGTEGGLNRYDGYQFLTYRHDERDTSSLPSNDIWRINEDSRGHLWVMTPKGLSELNDDGRFTTFYDSLTMHTMHSSVNYMVIDAMDRIWLRCNQMLTYFDSRQKKFIRALNFCAVPFLRNDGSLFAFGTDYRGNDSLFHHKALLWDETKGRFEELKDTLVLNQDHANLDFYDGTFDHAGNIWFCRPDGWLLDFNFQTRHYTYHPPLKDVPPRFNLGNTMLDICASLAGDVLWIASFKGIIRYDLRSGVRTPILRYEQNESDPEGLQGKVVTRVMEDRAGNLWAGLMGEGLCMYSPGKHKFQVFQKNPCDASSLPSNRVEALRFDHHGQLWVGTDKGLCLLKNAESGVFETFQHTEIDVKNRDWIYDIAEDTSSNQLYLGYWGRIPDVFDLSSHTFQPLRISNLPPKKLEDWCNSFNSNVLNDGRGHIFYGTWSGGFLQRYDLHSRQFTWYGWQNSQVAQQAGLLSEYTTKVYMTKDGTMWVGNDQDAGLMSIDFSKAKKSDAIKAEDIHCIIPVEPLDGALRSILPKNGQVNALQNGSSWDILEDKQGRLWIGTGAGLHWLKDREKGIFECYGKEAGFPDEPIRSLVEDSQGCLWVGTNRGLCRFDPAIGRVTALYDERDGLPGSSFLLQSCASGLGGQLAFGTTKGFCMFHPDSLSTNRHVPIVALLDIEANQVKKTVINRCITLPYDSASISLRYAVLDFSSPDENTFQYRMVGLETMPSSWSNRNEVLYHNLPPGSYEFRVSGANNDGVRSAKDLSLYITILPPWWRTWYFEGSLFLLLTGLIFYWVTWRERKIRQEKDNERKIKYLQVQTLQAQMNPHFIFNVLGTMQNLIRTSTPEEADRQLVNLSNLIRRFLDSTVNSALPGKGISNHEIALQEELELLGLYAAFEVLQRKKKFRGNGFDIIVDPSVNVATMRIPPMIVQPYLENAIKHGIRYLLEDGQGFVTVRFYKDADSLCCVIEDNGVGRQEAARLQDVSRQLYVSHGTQLVKQRVEILNQLDYQISIETHDGEHEGTIVTIKIKD